MNRGEVWWADLAAPAGRRPVLLLSRDGAYARRDSLTVAPITTRTRGIRTEVVVGADEGLPQPSVVNLDNMLTIQKADLRQYAGALSQEKIRAIEDAIHFALGLSY